MMHQNRKICRTCLGADNTTFLSLDATVPNFDFIPIKEQISFCMPDFVLDIVPDAVICGVCLTSLHTAFSFKRKCQTTEERIQEYIHSTKIDFNKVDLTKVIDPMGTDSDIKSSNKELDVLTVEKDITNPVDSIIKVEPMDYTDETTEAQSEAFENTKSVSTNNLEGGSKPHKCSVCGKAYKREIGLTAHMKTHETCQANTLTKEITSLTTRLQSGAISEVKQFLPKPCDNIEAVCEICQKSFYSKSNLTVHMRIHTGEKPYKCNTCKKAFTQKVYLIAHERTHTGEKPFKCSLCYKSFAQKSYLRTHMIVHTGIRHHICKVCGKGCAHTGDLNNHMRIHTGEKPYKCLDCGKCFTQSVHLKSHIKIHSGEKPFECQLCGAKYTESRYLKKHMRTHSGERPFSCYICEKTFHERYILNEHLKSHTGEKPYMCTLCNKTYSKSSHLTEHLRTHTGEKPFACTECGMNFAYKQSLNAHIKAHLKAEESVNAENGLVVIKNEVLDVDQAGNEPSTSDAGQNDDFRPFKLRPNGDDSLIDQSEMLKNQCLNVFINKSSLENNFVKTEPVATEGDEIT